MAEQSELDRLLQTEWRDRVIPNLGNNPWLIAYLYTDQDHLNWKKIHLGFIPNAEADAAIESHNWLIDSFDFTPCVRVQPQYQSSTPAFEYSRFGFPPNDMEPLVIERYSGNPQSRSIELAEEFRMFHNLYADRSRAEYRMTDDAGNEVTVVKWSQDFVQVRRQELREFAAAKHMAMIFHYIQYTGINSSLSDLCISDSCSVEQESDFIYLLQIDDWRGRGHKKFQSCSYLEGKAIIKLSPSQIEDISKRWFSTGIDDREHKEFIIDIDDNDNQIMCSPAGISHSTTKSIQDSAGNMIVVGFATPVFFKRSVIEKYKRQPSKYTLGDGFVQCGDFWTLRADTNHGDYVIVLMGDLKSLPISEQSYWQSYNVEPDGTVSITWYQRNVEAQFTDPDDSALRFKDSYGRLSEAWYQHFGWYLFKPLSEADSHNFRTLWRPLTEEPTELDTITISLSKLLVDSINLKQLRKAIPYFQPKDENDETKPSISVLEEFLTFKCFSDTESFISCLRTVQSLRSTSAAHRKGKNYEKVSVAVGLQTKSTVQVADEIFTTLTDFLDSLRAHFCPDDAA